MAACTDATEGGSSPYRTNQSPLERGQVLAQRLVCRCPGSWRLFRPWVAAHCGGTGETGGRAESPAARSFLQLELGW